MKPHARRGETAADLAGFVNALRSCLDLDPLYEDRGGRFSHARRRPTVEEQEAARFYVPSHEPRRGQTPWRGSDSAFRGGGAGRH